FGASGDLTYRKLIPAIFDLYMQDLLPENFAVLGVSRTELTDDVFRINMGEGIKQFSHFKDSADEHLIKFNRRLHYLSIKTSVSEEYVKLKNKLLELDEQENTQGNYIFYLSTPPSLYDVIPRLLAEQGLNKSETAFRRLIIEKPFGTNLESAIELNKSLLHNFQEDQLYRIDHYLGKETVQNVLVTRFSNGIYEPLWNRNFIQH